MATKGMFDLLGPTPQEIRAEYEKGLLGTPISDVPLLNRPAAMGAGLGRQFGYALGRMLGGQLPGEAEAEAQQNVLRQAQQEGLSGAALYRRLAEITADPRRALQFSQMAQQAEAQAQEAAAEAETRRLQQIKTGLEIARLEGEPARLAAGVASRTNMLRAAGLSSEDAAIYAADEQLTRDIVKEARKPESKKLTFKTVGNKVVALDSEGNIVKTIGDAPKGQSVKVDVALNPAKTTVDFSQKYDNLVKPERQALQGAQEGLLLLNQAAVADKDGVGNVSAWNAARTVIAKALGEGRLSNADIERLGGSAGLFRAVEDIVSKAFTGTPGKATQAQLYKVAKIIQLAKIQQINDITSKARKIHAKKFNTDKDELDLLFPIVSVPYNALP